MSKRVGSPRQCTTTGRRSYGTRSGAQKGARRREGLSGRSWTAVPCDACGLWHAVPVR